MSSTLNILYGTQTGNAERLAYRLGRYALMAGCGEISVLSADEVPVSSWLSLSPVLFVCSNANQGEAPLTFRETWKRLLDPSAPNLSGLFFAVFGVGDSLYEKFNYMGKMLHNRLCQLGATALVHRGLGDESDPKGLEDALEPFVMELWTVLGLGGALRVSSVLHSYAARDLPLFALFRVIGDAEADAAPMENIVRNPNHFFCEVTRNVRLTSSDHFQAVHHIELLSSFPEMEVGDALGVFVKNSKHQVDLALNALRYTGDEIVRVEPYVASIGSMYFQRQSHRDFFNEGALPLRRLLEDFVDLEAVVSQDFLWMLARLSDGESEEARDVQERLLELSDPGKPNEYLSYAHREKRNVVEVLTDFKQLRVSLDLFLSFAPLMRPRYFSVASSPQLDGRDQCQLTVAQLSWTTPMKRHREGLCSTTLVNSVPGSRFECCRWEGSLVLPHVPLPLICVATGSGVAPIRSLLRDWATKTAVSNEFARMPVLLFFGCRYATKDFLYEAEWKELQSTALPQLEVIPAFSRDTDTKTYVQHRLGQHASRIGALLRNPACPPVVYICGNAKQMPKDVGNVFLQILTEICCAGDDEEARRRLRVMHQEGRYQVDTWSS